MAQWDVLMFAYLRDRHGPVVTVEASPLTSSVLQALRDAGIDTTSCRLAADDEFVSESDAIEAGAELALIPPVSGG